MTIGELRKAVEGLPDDMEVIVQWKDGGQDEALEVKVCTHENGGLHYSRREKRASLRGEFEVFNPEGWERLPARTFRISV